MSAQPEIWRVSTFEGTFETDLDTLRQWILEGCVLPTDKVCKGTLNWIEAGRVPKLKGAFAGEATPIETPAPESTPNNNVQYVQPAPPNYASLRCHNHPEVAPHFICRICNATFCKECPRFVGTSNVPLCTLCGDLCRPYDDVKRRAQQSGFQSSGFGFSDLGRAVSYPFQHPAALVGGAILFGICLIAGFWGYLFSLMIMFGCISRVISQVAWGRFHRNFMPDFSEFNLLDDLVMPIFLGIGISIVSWGPTVALVVVMIFSVMNGVTHTAGPGGPIAQANGPTSEDLGTLVDPEADPQKLARANDGLNQTRPGVQFAREAEASSKRPDPEAIKKMMLPYLGVGIVFVLLLLVCLAWGIFYYPMALTVAGYTQSVLSVLNPLVGLDTIRRMRGTYFKAFGMVMVIQVVAFVVSVGVAIILFPFNLPFVGNLPANVVSGMFTFYFNLVIACLLGLSLYKCADRLGIDVD